MRTVVLRLSGHCRIGPSGVDAQSKVADELAHLRLSAQCACRIWLLSCLRVDRIPAVYLVHRRCVPTSAATAHDRRM